jgi:hypothetical protein
MAEKIANRDLFNEKNIKNYKAELTVISGKLRDTDGVVEDDNEEDGVDEKTLKTLINALLSAKPGEDRYQAVLNLQKELSSYKGMEKLAWDGWLREETMIALRKVVELEDVEKWTYPTLTVGMTLDEYQAAITKAGYTPKSGIGNKQPDWRYSYSPDARTVESIKKWVWLTFEDGDFGKKIIKIEDREMPGGSTDNSPQKSDLPPKEEPKDVPKAIENIPIDDDTHSILESVTYNSQTKETVIRFKKPVEIDGQTTQEKTYTTPARSFTLTKVVYEWEIFIVNHMNGRSVQAFKKSDLEISRKVLEIWKDKLWSGVEWKWLGDDITETRIDGRLVKAFFNLEVDKEEKTYCVVNQAVYVWSDATKKWDISQKVEIRGGKIEKKSPQSVTPPPALPEKPVDTSRPKEWIGALDIPGWTLDKEVLRKDNLQISVNPANKTEAILSQKDGKSIPGGTIPVGEINTIKESLKNAGFTSVTFQYQVVQNFKLHSRK